MPGNAVRALFQSMEPTSIDAILDRHAAWDIAGRIQAIEDRKEQHVAAGGHATAFYTAVTDVIYYRREEDPSQAEALNTLLFQLHSGIPGDYAAKFNRIEVSEDFYAAAALGLWKAIKTYEPGRGSFASWAYMEVRKYSHKALREKDHQTISETSLRERPKVLQAVAALTTRDREPTDKEVAAWIKAQYPGYRRALSASMVGMIRRPPRHSTSADPLSDCFGIATPLTTEDEVFARIDTRLAYSLLESLIEPREREIAVRAYGFAGEVQSFQAIGDSLGLSREAVRVILRKIEARWREQLRDGSGNGQ